MVRARAKEWQAEGDIHAFVECVELERNQSLIVIHAKDAVEVTLDRAVEYGVGGEGAVEIPMRFQKCDGGRNGLDFLAAEVAVFSGVGIQSSHGDAGIRMPAPLEKILKQPPDSHDFWLGEHSWHAGDRHMGGDEGDGEPTTSEAHGEIFHPRASGKKFGLAGKFKAHRVQGMFANWPGHDALPFARSEFSRRRLKRFQSGLGGFGSGNPCPVTSTAEQNFHFASRRRHQTTQCGLEHLGTDTRWIAGEQADTKWPDVF